MQSQRAISKLDEARPGLCREDLSPLQFSCRRPPPRYPKIEATTAEGALQILRPCTAPGHIQRPGTACCGHSNPARAPESQSEPCASLTAQLRLGGRRKHPKDHWRKNVGFVGLGAGQVSLQPGVLGGPSSENSKPGKAPVPQPYTEEQKVHFIALSLPLLCCVTHGAGLIKKPPARPRRLSLRLWELTGTSSRISPIGPNVRRVPIKKPKLRSGGRAGEGKRRKGRAGGLQAPLPQPPAPRDGRGDAQPFPSQAASRGKLGVHRGCVT